MAVVERSIAFGPSAFRGVVRDAQVTGVRAVQPVVRRVEPDPAVSTRPQATTYTPQSARPETTPLYSRKGAPAASSAVFAAASWDRKDTLDLQVQTAEGDVATLRFSQITTGSVRTGGVQTASQDTGLEVVVRGDLSDKERASINTLANQVRSVADDFFAGNMDGALKTASRMDISQQGDTLRAYAFSLESRETQMAAAIYEDVAKSTGPLNVLVPLAGPGPAASAPPATAEPSAKGLMKELLALFDRLTATAQPTADSPTPA